jgi:tryptophan synthase beta chain
LGEHAARFDGGSFGIFQGMASYVLQNSDGQVMGTHSISAGLDYASIGPEHALLRDLKRTEYIRASDAEALAGVHLLAENEGIIPALESAHALGALPRIAKSLPKQAIIIINISGRGDKDVAEIARHEGVSL